MYRILTVSLILILPCLVTAADNEKPSQRKVAQSQILRFETVVRGNEEQPKVIVIRPWLPMKTQFDDPPLYQMTMPGRLLRTETIQLIDP